MNKPKIEFCENCKTAHYVVSSFTCDNCSHLNNSSVVNEVIQTKISGSAILSTKVNIDGSTPTAVKHDAEKADIKGLKYDTGKPMMALIPPLAEEAEARVWTYGAMKYKDPITGEPGLYNWKKGITYLQIISSIQRHTNAIKRGEDIDPETGELHAAAIRCNAAMLIEFTLTKRTDLDNRIK